jgi:zona occludens toxin (predicted ATPase)
MGYYTQVRELFRLFRSYLQATGKQKQTAKEQLDYFL